MPIGKRHPSVRCQMAHVRDSRAASLRKRGEGGGGDAEGWPSGGPGERSSPEVAVLVDRAHDRGHLLLPRLEGV